MAATTSLLWVELTPLTAPIRASKLPELTSELVKLGWNVTLTAAGSAGRQLMSRVEILTFPAPKIYFFGQFLFHFYILRCILQRWTEFDVIIFRNNSALWLIPLRFIPHMTNRKKPLLVMDTRTVYMLPRDKATWKDKIRKVSWEIMEKMGNRWADGRLAITSRMAEEVNIPRDRLWGVFPSGVNLDLFKCAQETRRWPLPGDAIRLIYTGVLHYERNLITLCRAVEQANVEGMSFVLSLMGEGTERAELENFASRSHGRIRVVQPVPHKEVPRVLAKAHIGVLPFADELKFQVSSPIKLFEYMAAGLPILATRIACHTDVVGDGKYAFWAESADVSGLLLALRKVWQKRDSLSEMGTQAARASLKWTWHESAIKLRAALEFGLIRNDRARGIAR